MKRASEETLFFLTTDVYLPDWKSLSFWKLCFKILLMKKKSHDMGSLHPTYTDIHD